MSSLDATTAELVGSSAVHNAYDILCEYSKDVVSCEFGKFRVDTKSSQSALLVLTHL